MIIWERSHTLINLYWSFHFIKGRSNHRSYFILFHKSNVHLQLPEIKRIAQMQCGKTREECFGKSTHLIPKWPNILLFVCLYANHPRYLALRQNFFWILQRQSKQRGLINKNNRHFDSDDTRLLNCDNWNAPMTLRVFIANNITA